METLGNIRSTLLSQLETIRDKYMDDECDYDNATSKALNKIMDAIDALSSDQKAA